MMRYPHLSDDRLIDVCLQHAPAASDEQHLASCATCEERRASLTRLLTDTSQVATAEADALFTDQRLERQRAHILQRVDQESRHGRLISFPAARAPIATLLRARPASRWIAGAAAAGLFIGLLAGHLTHDFTAGRVLPRARVLAPEPTPGFQAVSATMSEEEFLGRLEVAVEGTGGSALRPLDDLTPLVWEVAAP
jgi:anti-sigma factor RsiW